MNTIKDKIKKELQKFNPNSKITMRKYSKTEFRNCECRGTRNYIDLIEEDVDDSERIFVRIEL